MVYILGINLGSGQDAYLSSACLIKDNEIIGFASQERFDRIKYSYNFPIGAINFCLSYGKITKDDLDAIAIDWSPFSLLKSSFYFGKYSPNYFNLINRSRNFKLLKQIYKDYNRIKKLFPLKKIIFIPHHLSHAASSFRLSGFKNSNILVIDGRGENDSLSVFSGKNNHIQKSFSKSFFHNFSFGLCYSTASSLLGFGYYNAGRLMGLADYGKPTFNLKNIIDYDPMKKKVSANFSALYKKFHRYKRTGSIKKIHENMASSVQNSLEKSIIGFINDNITDDSVKNLCFSGGVALNCKLNGVILEKSIFDDFFIQPASTDDGCALGAALEAYKILGHDSKKKLEHVYYGPEFDNDEIGFELKKSGYQYDYCDDIAGVAAELLDKEKIIGWFQGRMEFGPRALGNRSILANPSVKGMNIKVNKLKGREIWRPLAPSIIENCMKEYFCTNISSRFMLLSLKVRQEKIREIPSVVHVDGNSRPQTVTKEVNPLFYRLIKSFEEISSIPVVLNTSFNASNEPIVCSPSDAIKSFEKMKLDYLLIGNFLVKS